MHGQQNIKTLFQFDKNLNVSILAVDTEYTFLILMPKCVVVLCMGKRISCLIY